ncbi:hypothetical protein M422DRAFT_782492 [Sphaerobolus stellatus SS14]|uniref:Unplaced genomic scaffold SPHSTscaffold_112, whole genome shotgun sequence n=1 Tax=Sphaerobolus stellatus (strain SS14) TaxID=990650 RepID=A0A0C9UBY0_SPHS4|nr:hypothetical protein M422DRAFT_785183 [Sphaerobolus stellatus SS14]KIJ35553.1 hypothetical protein M422DRAFT_782492 [Sphaerobolus stellatus SS14]
MNTPSSDAPNPPSTPLSERGCALNSDGTFKDANSIEWLNSPSDEGRTEALQEASSTIDVDGSDGGTPTPTPTAEPIRTRAAVKAVEALKTGKPAPAKHGGKRASVSVRKSLSLSNLDASKPAKKKRKTGGAYAIPEEEDPVETMDEEDNNDEDRAASRQEMADADKLTGKRRRGGGAKDIPLIFTKDMRGGEKGITKSWRRIAGLLVAIPCYAHILRGIMIATTKKYFKKCQVAGIQPHARCIPKDKKEKVVVPDPTLEQFGFNPEDRHPPFSKDNLLDYIIKLVVEDDQAFELVEKKPFRALIRFLQPTTKELEIPHCTKLREAALDKARKAVEILKEKLNSASVPGLISFTFDAWTSRAYDPYLAVTAHYIYSPPDDMTK